MHGVKLLLSALCVLWVTGCSHHYVPGPSRPFEAIPEFASSHSVNLKNGQPSKDPVVFWSPGAHTYYANLNAWTKVAIDIAAREMAKRGMQIATAAPKTLTLSVQSAESKDTGWTHGSKIIMRAETSDGYSATYTGHNSSAAAFNLQRQLDGAMMRVVVEMLKDPKIVAFLTR